MLTEAVHWPASYRNIQIGCLLVPRVFLLSLRFSGEPAKRRSGVS